MICSSCRKGIGETMLFGLGSDGNLTSGTLSPGTLVSGSLTSGSLVNSPSSVDNTPDYVDIFNPFNLPSSSGDSTTSLIMGGGYVGAPLITTDSSSQGYGYIPPASSPNVTSTSTSSVMSFLQTNGLLVGIGIFALLVLPNLASGRR
jgi:hypothetical protein